MAAVVHITKCTRLIGKITFAREGRNAVNAFLGIPYARPPVGDLRFQAPQPIELWEGERKATTFGPICPQDIAASAKTHHPFPMPEVVSEDCLYLNIWTPVTKPEKSHDKKAVMFWIYGGSFLQGFSDFYDGTAFAANHNVIVVSFNYRVGAFGFLCTGDEVVPGNAGLLDQVAALKWVRQHIDKFGGDPENITVFGESAGGISTSLHLCSPLSKGLFRRAICQSGTALHPSSAWKYVNARNYLIKRLKAMGCQASDSRKMVDFLNSLSSEDLVMKLGGGFAPVIDNHFLMGNPPHQYYSTKTHPDVDLMIGFNSHEGAQFIFSMAKAKKLPGLEAAIAMIDTMVCKAFFRGLPNINDILKLIVDKYLEAKDTMSLDSLTEAVSAAYGDVLFVAPSIKTADIHSRRSTTYLYRFNHRLSLSSYPSWVIADHGNEIPLVFGEPWLQRFPDMWTDSDKVISKTMMTYWSNFAKTGDPNSEGLTDWPKYSSKGRQYLQLEERPIVCDNHEPSRMSFWNDTVEGLASSKSKY